MWENNEYKLCLKEESILGFERIMLASGQCSHLLPMVFICDEKGLLSYYDCGGFVPISSFRVDRTEDALFVLEKVLLIISRLVEYLINPEKMLLSTDTVFFNPETGQIKIAYVPHDSGQGELRRQILKLIALLKADVSDGKESILDSFAGTVFKNNYRTIDLVNVLGMLRRQLYSQTSAS